MDKMIKQLPIPAELLASSLRRTFDSQADVIGFYALTGGARKKVFRLKLTQNLPDVALLVWQNDRDYFEERDNPNSTRSDQQAPFLYRANTELLVQNGLKVPQLYHFEGSCEQVPFSFALVEYKEAKTFNEWRIDRSPQEVKSTLVKIRAFLERMHAIERDNYGTVLDSSPKSIPCYEKALQEIRSDLQGLAEAMKPVRENESRVNRKLEQLSDQIQPRDRYSFIHDELGPDEHLLIEKNGEITIIDLDGCHFFDVEREFGYLQIRFGQDFETLRQDGLDDARMAFYTLCIHISAAYGHYQLYRKGFPDAPMLRSIYEWNIQQFLHISQLDEVRGRGPEV